MITHKDVISRIKSAIIDKDVNERVAGIKAYTCLLNYYKPFEIATSRTEREYVLLIRLRVGDIEGFGEIATSRTIDIEKLVKEIRDIDEKLRNKPITEAIEHVFYSLRDHALKLAFTTAILDAAARLLNVNFGELFSKVERKEILTDITIGIESLEETMRDLEKALENGFKAIKLKVGKGGIEKDFERIRAVAERLPEDTALRIDANQGWTYKEALEIIPRIEKLNAKIEFIEQPLHRDLIDEINKLRTITEIPIIVDESFRKSGDLNKVLGKVDGINLKIVKAGDPVDVFVAGKNAKEKELLVMMGCAGETNIGITVDAFLASIIPVDFADLDSDLMKEDILKTRVTELKDSKRILPTGKGLSVTENNLLIEKLKLIYQS